MENLPKILDSIVLEMDDYDVVREQVVALTRELNRLSGRGIAFLVMGKSAGSLLDDGRKVYDELRIKVLSVVEMLSWRTAIPGVEEFAEFVILNSILNEGKIPSPKECNIPSWIWLPALGDVTGELRRVILNRMLSNNFDDVRPLLVIMQEIFHEISGLTFSKSLISTFRKKVDVARMTLERTESDVFSYVVSRGVWLIGEIRSGFGRGAKFISLQVYSDIIKDYLGETPFPGTLNINLQMKDVETIDAKFAESGIVYDKLYHDGRKMGGIIVLPVLLSCDGSEVNALLIRPLLTRHTSQIVEAVAVKNLRKLWNIKNDCRIKLVTI